MNQETEDSLARLVDRQRERIEALTKERDALLEAAKISAAITKAKGRDASSTVNRLSGQN